MPEERQRRRAPVVCTIRALDVLVLTVFFSVVAYCAYDGFKEIFADPNDREFPASTQLH